MPEARLVNVKLCKCGWTKRSERTFQLGLNARIAILAAIWVEACVEKVQVNCSFFFYESGHFLNISGDRHDDDVGSLRSWKCEFTLTESATMAQR